MHVVSVYNICMNKLSTEKRAAILRLLVEGMSMRSITRTVKCSINTVTKLLEELGKYLAEFQDETLRDLPCTRLEVDEAWAFVYAKNKNVERAKAAPEDAGDGWTWTAICADTKLIPTWRVGDRTSGTAIPFIRDLTMSGCCFTEPSWRDPRDSCRMRGGARSCPAGRTRTARPD